MHVSYLQIMNNSKDDARQWIMNIVHNIACSVDDQRANIK